MTAVDANTDGQYGEGIGSEDETRQLDLLFERLREYDPWYRDVEREVSYPNRRAKCDIVLPDGTPVECKLIRYWRANGDPEDYMPKAIFSPFHENTILTDVEDLHASDFEREGGLLGLFYKRSDDDSQAVQRLPERYTAEDLAEKVERDIEYWYDIEATVSNIAEVEGLQHSIHKQGAAITWRIES